jgi:hypothetical protein
VSHASNLLERPSLATMMPIALAAATATYNVKTRQATADMILLTGLQNKRIEVV